MKEGKKFMNNDQSFLGTEPVGKLLMRLAVPTVIAQLVNMLYNIVDRIYIGHMPGDGSLALTGVGVCMPIIMIVTAFAALVASGGAPRASIALGRGDRDTAEQLLGNCFTLQIIISLTLTVILRLFGRGFLLAFGASENTIEYAVSYLNIYALGTLFVELTLGMNAFITAQGFATTGMLTVLIGAVCNIALDPLFIFGLKMGVRGAALATVISQGVSCLWVVSFLRGKKDQPASEKGQPQNQLEADSPLPCARTVHVHHAKHGEHHLRLLQFLSAQVRRRYRRRRDDHSDQRDAVCHAPAARSGAGRAADFQL